LIGVSRSAWQYEPLRGQDDVVRLGMREIANERCRFAYRRLANLLECEGNHIASSHDSCLAFLDANRQTRGE
jgi:hypothetical protein